MILQQRWARYPVNSNNSTYKFNYDYHYSSPFHTWFEGISK